MKRTTCSILTVLASLALISPVYAASEFSEQARGTTFNQNTELRHNNTSDIKDYTKTFKLSRTESADQLIGLPVVAQDGDKIGEIRDLKVDARTGRIDYAVVERKDAMGVGEDVAVAVPLGALQFSDENARLTVDRSRLDNAPNPANMTARQFNEDLNSHYGLAPTWQEEPPQIIHHEESTTVKP